VNTRHLDITAALPASALERANEILSECGELELQHEPAAGESMPRYDTAHIPAAKGGTLPTVLACIAFFVFVACCVAAGVAIVYLIAHHLPEVL